MVNLFERAAARLPWVRRKTEKLSHRRALLRLEAQGFAPRIVYDIGAYRGGWSRLAGEVFPGATFILFDANADNSPYLDATGHRYFTVALAEADGDRPFFLPRFADVTGASLYVENSVHYAGDNLVARNVPSARLDSLVATQDLPPAELIKIDVQGAELDVIAGGAAAMVPCMALIAELSFVSHNKGAPLMAEVTLAIERHGFHCVDVCELHRAADGRVLQADFLFVKPPLFAAMGARAGFE